MFKKLLGLGLSFAVSQAAQAEIFPISIDTMKKKAIRQCDLKIDDFTMNGHPAKAQAANKKTPKISNLTQLKCVKSQISEINKIAEHLKMDSKKLASLMREQKMSGIALMFRDLTGKNAYPPKEERPGLQVHAFAPTPGRPSYGLDLILHLVKSDSGRISCQITKANELSVALRPFLQLPRAAMTAAAETTDK